MPLLPTLPGSEQCLANFPLQHTEALGYANDHLIGMRLEVMEGGAVQPQGAPLHNPAEPQRSFGLSASVVFAASGVRHCPCLSAFGRCKIKDSQPLACRAFPLRVPESHAEVEAWPEDHPHVGFRGEYSELMHLAHENHALAAFVTNRLAGFTGLSPDPDQLTHGARLGGMVIMESFAGCALFLVSERGLAPGKALEAVKAQARLATEALNGLWVHDPEFLETIITQSDEVAALLQRMQAVRSNYQSTEHKLRAVGL